VDIGNFLSCGEDAGPAVEATANLAAHVHVKDMRKFDAGDVRGRKAERANYNLESCAVGEGVVPLVRCFQAFKKAGYQGYLSLEYEGVNENEHEGVAQSLVAMRNALKQVK
jgi:sugar phosphate isomerase/epimerase